MTDDPHDALRETVARAMTDRHEETGCKAGYPCLAPLPCSCDYDARAALAALGIPLATLAGLRDGSLVAVPREGTREMLDAMRRPLDPEFPAGLTVFRGIYRAMVAAAEGGR